MDEVADKTRQERGLGPNDSISRRNGVVCHDAFLSLKSVSLYREWGFESLPGHQ